jgi:hypothetical protein
MKSVENVREELRKPDHKNRIKIVLKVKVPFGRKTECSQRSVTDTVYIGQLDLSSNLKFEVLTAVTTKILGSHAI